MFSLSPPAFVLWLGCVALTVALSLGSSDLVEAQPTPPSTFFGKATAPDGEVAGGLDVLAYVDGVVCSEEEPQQTIRTELEGELVTSYLVRVLSSQQKAGCGEDGDEVRLQIGGRFAEQTATWRSGPEELDLTLPAEAPEGTEPEEPVEPEVTPEATETEEAVDPEVTPETTGPEEPVDPEVTPEATEPEEPVEPEVTPEATETEEPIEPEVTPEATETEEPVEPEVTPEATETEEAVEPEVTPEATETEEPVEEAESTETPVATESPTATEAPTATATATATATEAPTPTEVATPDEPAEPRETPAPPATEQEGDGTPTDGGDGAPVLIIVLSVVAGLAALGTVVFYWLGSPPATGSREPVIGGGGSRRRTSVWDDLRSRIRRQQD